MTLPAVVAYAYVLSTTLLFAQYGWFGEPRRKGNSLVRIFAFLFAAWGGAAFLHQIGVLQ